MGPYVNFRQYHLVRLQFVVRAYRRPFKRVNFRILSRSCSIPVCFCRGRVKSVLLILLDLGKNEPEFNCHMISFVFRVRVSTRTGLAEKCSVFPTESYERESRVSSPCPKREPPVASFLWLRHGNPWWLTRIPNEINDTCVEKSGQNGRKKSRSDRLPSQNLIIGQNGLRWATGERAGRIHSRQTPTSNVITQKTHFLTLFARGKLSQNFKKSYFYIFLR